MPMSSIVILGTFKEGYEPHYEEYSRRVSAFLGKRDATVVRSLRIERTLYGQGGPQLIVVIDFPDKDRAAEAFFDPEYLEIVPVRARVFEDFHMYLAKRGEIETG